MDKTLLKGLRALEILATSERPLIGSVLRANQQW